MLDINDCKTFYKGMENNSHFHIFHLEKNKKQKNKTKKPHKKQGF